MSRCYLHFRAFTLIEMLTTVALLVIVLGLMVSLARYVRATSSTRVTTELLRDLDRVMSLYISRHSTVPRVHPLIVAAVETDAIEDGPGMQRAALANNEQLLRALKTELAMGGSPLDGLPLGLYDGRTVRDAWGMPVVFMAHQNPSIGMAAEDRPFFFSAGPDRKYLTRDDNLYSYERPEDRPR